MVYIYSDNKNFSTIENNNTKYKIKNIEKNYFLWRNL